MPVYFGVDTRRVPEATLLSALAEVGRQFDEQPTTMMAVLADSGPIRWLTFRCTTFAKGRAMAGGFFQDIFAEALPEHVCIEVDDLLGTELVFHARTAEGRLCVRSDGTETLVTLGSVGAEVPREGDAIDLGLAALGWPPDRVWESIGTKSPRVVLRQKRSIVGDPVLSQKGGRLPNVGVIVSGSQPRFETWRDKAIERFAMKAKKVAPKRAKAGARPEAVRVQFRVGKTAAMPDLSAVIRVTGRLEVIDDYKRGSQYGVKEVDLGAIEELVYPCDLYVQGKTLAIRARALVKADSIRLRLEGDPEVSLPRLRELRIGAFGDESYGPIGTLELPSLAQVKKALSFSVSKRRFAIRLPALKKGSLTIKALRARDIDPDSVLEAPLLDASAVEIVSNSPAVKAALQQIVRRGTRSG